MKRDAHVEVALEHLARILHLDAHRNGARVRVDQRSDIVDPPGQCLAGAGDDFRFVADVNRAQIGLEDVGHHPDVGEVGHRERRRRARLEELAG